MVGGTVVPVAPWYREWSGGGGLKFGGWHRGAAPKAVVWLGGTALENFWPAVVAGSGRCICWEFPLVVAFTPAPSWRLSLDPADRDQCDRGHRNNDGEDDSAGGPLQQRYTPRDTGDVNEHHQPALPRDRKSPAPTIAFRREPVIGCFLLWHREELSLGVRACRSMFAPGVG